MTSFRYRALTQNGEIVSGSVSATTSSEVGERIAYLGLIPIETVAENETGTSHQARQFFSFAKPRAEDLTIFTGDLALLLKTGARINVALELLATDADIGRMRPTISAIAAAILTGESLGEAVARHPTVFPPVYIALVKVGEASGTLVPILEALCSERQRSEAMQQRVLDALRYPAFLLCAAGAVLLFFLMFVLPQFASLFKDFNAKLDPILVFFLAMSDGLRSNYQSILVATLVLTISGLAAARTPSLRNAVIGFLTRLPLISPSMEYYRATLLCRNLGLLLSSGVTLSTSLRILADIMGTTGTFTKWSNIIDMVRHGGKLSDALMANKALPTMAIRTLRLGEDAGQLPMLAGRVAEFYEARLQRRLDRMMGIVGPVAIIFISVIVGGLIVSVMTALISVNQVVR